jgi:hypothetical protein
MARHLARPKQAHVPRAPPALGAALGAALGKSAESAARSGQHCGGIGCLPGRGAQATSVRGIHRTPGFRRLRGHPRPPGPRRFSPVLRSLGSSTPPDDRVEPDAACRAPLVHPFTCHTHALGASRASRGRSPPSVLMAVSPCRPKRKVERRGRKGHRDCPPPGDVSMHPGASPLTRLSPLEATWFPAGAGPSATAVEESGLLAPGFSRLSRV